MNEGAYQGFANPLLSSGGTVPLPTDSQIITQTGVSTYICPADGLLVMRAIGADGSSAVAHGTGLASGAGAGECVDKVQPVKMGDAITFNLGTGGASVTRAAAGVTDGNDGGDSTISGPNALNIVLKGGKKGRATTTLAAGIAGGDGGQGGYGGDIHRPGGRGGTVSAGGASNCATGGGGVNFGSNLSQAACRGGDITAPTGASSTGGGGTNGRAGDINASNSQTAGGGSGGDAIDGSTPLGKGGKNKYGTRTPLVSTLLNPANEPFGINMLDGNGADGTNAPGAGGGGCGSVSASNTNGNSFAGCGAIVNGNSPGVLANTNVWYGAPGGVNLSAGSVTTLKGRDAMVFLRLYPLAK